MLRPNSDRIATVTAPSVGTLAVAGALVVALALAGTLVVTAAAAPAASATQADRPTVDVATASLADGETTTVAVWLSDAPEGLSGYNLELAVADAGVARIESASYPDRFGLTTDPRVGPEGRTVTLEAADLDDTVDPGATNVTLARVNVTGVGPGAANLSVEPVQFDGNDGSRIEPVPRPGVVTVGSTDAADPGGPAATPDGSDPGAPGDVDGRTSTSGDGSLATAPLIVAAALVSLGAIALRRRLS